MVQGGCQLFILSIKFKLSKWVLFLYFKIFHQIRFYGRGNVPITGPVIIAPNHISYYDPVIMGAGLNRDVEFMAWGRLFTIPVLRKMIRFFGAFPVDVSKADKSAYVNAIRALRKGKALMIFPEGKRSDDGEVVEFKLGLVRIAFMTNSMIVPVTIAGAYDAWPKHRLLPRPRRISVYYHRPISIDRQDFAGNKDKHKFFDEVTNQIRKTISSKLKETKKVRTK